MKKKIIYTVLPLGAAVLLSACGRNDEYDRNYHAVATAPRETVVMTDRPNHNYNYDNNNYDAGDVVGDVVDDGADIVSDVVQGGREVAGDVNSAIDDIARRESNSGTDANDNYSAGTDGRVESQTTVR